MTHTIKSTLKVIFNTPKWLNTYILFLLSLLSMPLSAQVYVDYTADGTFNVPAGVARIKVECWGGGGGGASANDGSNVYGAGGGGGAYAMSILSLTENSNHSVTVGTGGAAGTVGLNSSFGAYVIAFGGNGATNNSTTSFGTGGSASSSTGDVKYNGGNGGVGKTTVTRYSGGGGGAASYNGAGGNASGLTAGTSTSPGGAGGAGRTSNNNGLTGNTAGGGGGGAYRRTSGSYTGGSGASGLVRVTNLYVEVTATLGDTQEFYATLSDAIAAINGSVHLGAVKVKLYSSLTETSTLTLNSGSYSSVTIFPVVSGVTLSGSFNGPLISLNGADNVTIDGSVNEAGSTQSMIVENTSTGASATTILINNSAQNNTVKYCLVKGGGGSTTNGTIQFGTSGTNSNNTVTNCSITNNGTRRSNAIYSVSGTNTGISILNNALYDTWLSTATNNVYSIYLGSGASTWTISDNSFYDTGVAAMSGAYVWSAIYINNTSVDGFTIYNNHIGGSAVLCGGSPMAFGTTTASGTTFYPIYLNIGTTNLTTLYGNEIKNINYRSSAAAPFVGINVNAGKVTLNSNDVGDAVGSSPLTLTSSVATATSYGISLASTNVLNVLNNRITRITVGSVTSTNNHNFTGIYKGIASGTLTITGNTIGHDSNAASINLTSTSTSAAQTLYGIYSICSETVVISNNTIANLTNATSNTASGTAGTVTGLFSSAGTNTISGNIVHDLTIANGSTSLTTPSACGLMLTSTTTGKMVSGNRVNNLSNSYASAGVYVVGLYYAGATSTTNTVEKNLIYGLSATSSAGIVQGIQIASGLTTYSNNIVSLSNDLNNVVYGVYDAGATNSTCNFYHNTIYLGGTASGSANSYAFYSATATNTRNYRSNIFFNARSSSSANYAIYYVSTNVGNLTTDYNDYRVTGTNGIVGYFNASAQTLASLRTAMGKDANSIDTDPGLVAAGGTAAVDYKTLIQLMGTSTGITVDYNNDTRYSYTMGAWEFLPVKVWQNGTLVAMYGNLKTAFDRINDGTWTGNIKIVLVGSTVETASAVLNASGSGSASYSRVTLYPESSDIVVSGNFNNPLINLKGSKNVYINGSVYLNNTSPDLTFRNTNTGNNASVILFSDSAQNNSINYCHLVGNPLSSTLGIVTFSTSAVGMINKLDTIANCEIFGIGTTSTTRPYNAIYSNSTNGTNTDIHIFDNEIYNFLNPNESSNGIYVGANSTKFTIDGNSFYETTAFAATSGVAAYQVINIDNTAGGGYVVSNNHIGGNSALSVGTWTKSGNNNLFNALRLNVGNGNRTSIQGNTVRGFNYSNTANANWYIINILTGGVDVGTTQGNQFGETSGVNSIYLTNASSGGAFYGIYTASTNVITIDNNTFGSISTGTTGVADTMMAYSFYGIYKEAGGGIFNVRGNQIGGLNTINSLMARSKAFQNAQTVIGVYSGGTDSVSIDGNTVANLVNSTTSNVVAMTRGIMTVAGSNTIDNNIVHDIFTLNAQSNNYNNATLIGIQQLSEQASSIQRIRGNQVYSLRNRTYSTIEMYGIFYKGPASGDHVISRNFVHTFIIISTNMAYLHGISLHTGTYTCSNNVVFLGDTITTGCQIWGIWNNSNSPIKIYHNTVYLNGNIPLDKGTSNTFAFRDISNAPTSRDIRNNIFWNARRNAETISHYALYFAQTGNTTLDYNDYQYAEKFALAVGVPYTTQQDWVNAFPFDDNSLDDDPLLTNLGGISPSDYQTGVQLIGTPLSGQTTDYGFLDRSLSVPTMGAWEFVAAPVEVWNGMVHRQDFKTLKMAFDTINSGKWTGDLTIKIKSNIKETAPAVLYQSGYTGGGGTSSYSKIHIYPTRTDLQIYGKLASTIVELNGAKGVTFDGRVNGVGAPYNLTIKNDSVSAVASTVVFKNSAESDTLKYCYLKGLSTNPNGGIVHISTSTGGTGNRNNAIVSNKITVVDSKPSDKFRVINAIYSGGSSGFENSANSILNNEVYDVWSESASSYGIHVGPYSTAFTISGNSIFESTTFTPAGAYTYNSIRIDNASGNNFNITGNYLGGNAVQCQGSPLLIGTTTPASTFAVQPLYLNVGASTATSVQGNFIRNFRLTSPNTTPFTGIYVQAGAVNVGTSSGNNIGAATGIESIYIIGVSANSASYGVYVNSAATVDLSNNNIGSISTDVTASTNGHTFYGIYKPAVAGLLTISGNVIGSLSTTFSIRGVSASSSNPQSLYGIYSQGTGNTTIYKNTIANIRNNSTRNSIDNNLDAVYFNGSVSATNTMEGNFIYYLSHANTSTSATNRMSGVYLAGGSANVVNNIIWIGSDLVNNSFNLYGIYDQSGTGQTNLIYHNTVLMDGASAGTTLRSYGYIKAATNGVSDIRNNIFYNKRTGATLRHYGLSLPGSSLVNVTLDGNDYYCALGANNFLNYYISDRITLAAWKTATSKDGAALNSLPFIAPTVASALNFRPILDLPGVDANVGYDYGLNPRNATTPTMGAWERVNKWKGNISIDFNTPANWTFNMVPAAYDNIIFDDAPNRPCTMDQARFVTDIVNNQSTYRFIVNGYTLTIRGNLTFANGAQLDASALGSTVEFNGLSAQSIPSGSFYQNKVYNLTINNSNNVTLNGSMVLMNSFTTTLGKLNATGSGSTVTFGGTTAQVLNGAQFISEKAYNVNVENAAGVTLSTNFTVDNNVSISTGALLTVPEMKSLTVTGVLTNNAGTGGLLLKSSALGTASLNQSNGGVPGTMQRYIVGDSLDWHFMSAPVSNQSISGSWTPAGGLADGVGYDLFTWDELHSCWVYKPNTTEQYTWASAHPESHFVSGRGYLYAIESMEQTNAFVGLLNGGTISRPITFTVNDTVSYDGFNLLGNPYPSTIDWRIDNGFFRSMLTLSGGGYDYWTWSTTANNYGVYNSEDADVDGTNHITSYIAPMQAFFVRAATPGTFNFYNAARGHDSASVWLKSAKVNAMEQNVRLSVTSPEGRDEVKFGFGYEADEAGAVKLFSPVLTAPSLYMSWSGQGFTTRRLTDTTRNKYVPVNFKAGVTGSYTLDCKYDASTLGTIFLEDRLTGAVLDLSGGESYTFQASTSDAPERFVLHFGAVTPVDMDVHPNVWMSAGVVNVYLENMIGDYTMRVTDLNGRLVAHKKMSGSEQCSVSLFGRGIYLVTVFGADKHQTIKVVY